MDAADYQVKEVCRVARHLLGLTITPDFEEQLIAVNVRHFFPSWHLRGSMRTID